MSEKEFKNLAIKLVAILNEQKNQFDELRHVRHQNAILRSDLQETRRRLDAIERQLQRSQNCIRTPLQELQTGQDVDDQKENTPQFKRNLRRNSKIQTSKAGEHGTDVATKDQDTESLPDANQDISSAFSNIQITDPALSPEEEEEPNISSFLSEIWGDSASQDPAQRLQDQIIYLINFGVLPEYAEYYLARASNDTNAALNDYFDDERDAQAYIYLGNEGMPTVWRQRFLDHTGSAHAALTLYRQNEDNIALLRLGRDEEETWRFLVETGFDPERFREKLEEGTRAGPRGEEERMDMDLYEEDEGYVGDEGGDVMSGVMGDEDGDENDSSGDDDESYDSGIEKDHTGDENKTPGEIDS